MKHLTSLRLDADLLAWFKRGGNGYQTRIRVRRPKRAKTHGSDLHAISWLRRTLQPILILQGPDETR